jgi:uncharacterized membrane protein YgcG
MTCPIAAATRGPARQRQTPMPHRGRVAALASVSLALALALAPAAVLGADALPRLQDRVTDQADVLSDADVATIQQALDALEDSDNIQLFVAFVDSTGVEDVSSFTEGVAETSSLGGNDALLLVAVEDRSDALWVGDALDEVTDAEIDAILGEHVEPNLADGDFAGAAVAGAEALGEASTGSILPTVPPAGETAPPVDEGEAAPAGGFNLTPVLALLLLVGGGVLVVRALLDRRRRTKEAGVAHARLSQDANRALLAVDEALKDAANDVEFAAAQWGEDEVTAYRLAIANATGELRTAFEIRQRLDDAEPEPPPEQERMLQEIVARTSSASKLLDEQEQRFDQLRDLEEAAPAQLQALGPQLEALRARRAAAVAEYARIADSYAPSAVTSVAGNDAEADKAIASAQAEAARGLALVGTKRSEAVIALRRAQEGIARATRLLDAVERLATSLDEAAARLPAELDAAATDVATAHAGVTDSRSLPPLAPGISTQPPLAPGGTPVTPGDPVAALAAAERLLDEARRAAEARPLDPLAALARATQANQAADAIIAGLREAEAQRTRRLQVAATAVASARGHVQRATDYITTRRHGVGREARTRAAEAALRLEEAERVAATDPDAAITSSQRATQLADEAYRLAAAEFDGWDQGSGPIAGPYARRGGSSDADIIGAVLGGVIGGVLSGGRGAGWGGSTWGGPIGRSGGSGGFGMPGPFGGGGRGGGIGLPGPFGGGGGGGGGGGRVRGGRW